MTINDFQEKLRDDLLLLYKDLFEKNPDGTLGKINGYIQNLPEFDDEDEAESRFPYFIVRVMSGTDEELDQIRGSVKVLILIGVYDNNKENVGHKIILKMIQMFRERFEEEARTSGYGYRMRPKIEWALQDEDTFPYFFGGIETDWDIMLTRKEDPYS